MVLAAAIAAGWRLWGMAKAQNAPVTVPVGSPSPAKAIQPARPVSSANNALAAENITLEKTTNSSVVYAVGMIKNKSDRQRFGVKIELDLLDPNSEKIGTATDYLSILEPRTEWRFKALVLDAKAVSARVARVHEEE